MEEGKDLASFIFGAVVILLFIAMFAAAGTCDYESELAYRRSWYAMNGVVVSE